MIKFILKEWYAKVLYLLTTPPPIPSSKEMPIKGSQPTKGWIGSGRALGLLPRGHWFETSSSHKFLFPFPLRKKPLPMTQTFSCQNFLSVKGKSCKQSMSLLGVRITNLKGIDVTSLFLFAKFESWWAKLTKYTIGTHFSMAKIDAEFPVSVFGLWWNVYMVSSISKVIKEFRSKSIYSVFLFSRCLASVLRFIPCVLPPLYGPPC